jgi:NADH-quinone oxidoreductase subunit N
LIDAAVSGSYTWLGVVIVIGSMISLGYYLPVVAAMWMREAPVAGAHEDAPALSAGALPALAGGSPELDEQPSAAQVKSPQPEVIFVAVLAGAATLFFGILPSPLFNLVHGAGSALGLF